MTDLLDTVLAAPEQPYALLCRPFSSTPGEIEVLVGDVDSVARLADIPLRGSAAPGGPEALVVVPYRQLTERGLACVDDHAPLLVMNVREHAALPKENVLGRLPADRIKLSGAGFDTDDVAYADLVRRVITDEIGTGEGANFVIRRSFVAEIEDYHAAQALAFFRRLCAQESGFYWAFVLNTGDRTFVGATPERHVSLDDGVVTMNPISGTYRYPAGGPTLSGTLDFLADRKETDELYMVLDEELKMMSRICDTGVRVIGPRLKEMARLAHTEYFIEGRSGHDVREILRETMFAPTVTGSPVESACRVISRHERHGRGYYSGVAALIGSDEQGRPEMDSVILIRTAQIDRAGRVDIGVGATLVRHSDPASEAAETRAKVAALLSALQDGPLRWDEHPAVLAALRERNTRLGPFWFRKPDTTLAPASPLTGLRALVVDAEDTFTWMIAHQLRSLGLVVDVRRFDEDYRTDPHDIVVMGPGPGDPRDGGLAKIARLNSEIRSMLRHRQPLLAVCLSHQILCDLLGLEIVRRDKPNQGTHCEIDLFGVRETVGFYNTFAAHTLHDTMEHPEFGLVEIACDSTTGEVHATRGDRFASAQFHPESVLTRNGPDILTDMIKSVLVAKELPHL